MESKGDINIVLFYLKEEEIDCKVGSKDILFTKNNKVIFNISFEQMLGCLVVQLKSAKFQAKIQFYYVEEEDTKYTKFGIDKLKKRTIKNLNLFHKEEAVLNAFRDSVMRKFYESQTEKHLPKIDKKRNQTYYKKALVFVNPVGGKKKAWKIYNEYEKYLRANGMILTVIETKPDRFTEIYIKCLPEEKLREYDLVIAVSGDGIIQEIISGFMRRRDMNLKKEFPVVATLPGGSGCALLENNTKYSGVEWTVENAIYAICHWKKKKVAISKYPYLDINNEAGCLYGFLCLVYGYPADAIVNSEKIRFLGDLRYSIYLFVEWVTANEYKSVVTYPKHENGRLPVVELEIEEESNYIVNKESTYLVMSFDMLYATHEYRAAPFLENTAPGKTHLQFFEKRHGKIDLIKFAKNQANHNPEDNHNATEAKVSDFRLDLDPKRKRRLVTIDGENFENLNIKRIQKTFEGHYFYTLV